jgi:hypothetical protein
MITGRYSLKYFIQFAKWAALCHTVKMYIRENNYPTVFVYQITDICKASIVISPKVEDDINQQEDENDDEQEIDIDI